MAHTFALVHGGWLGGWCWRRVADRLRERGHVVFTPTLTGLGERSLLLSAGIDLDTHIADVVNVVKWERLNDVVLCGHSFSGFVISGVAEQIAPAIRSIVFLDAFVPSDGDSIQGLAGDAIRDGVRGAMQRGSAGVLPRSAETFGVNEADRAWADGLCVRQPIRPSRSRAPASGSRGRPISVQKDITITPSIALLRPHNPIRRGAVIRCRVEMMTMVDMPERLAELLLQAAA